MSETASLGRKSYCLINGGRIVKMGSKGIPKKYMDIDLFENVLNDGIVSILDSGPVRWYRRCGNRWDTGVSEWIGRAKKQRVTMPMNCVVKANYVTRLTIKHVYFK